jgi:hypothetical protein
MLSGLLCLPRLLIEDEIREKIDNLNISKAMICLLVSFSIGFIFIVRVIPPNYWRGWDPWLNTPVIQVILEKGLNPYELVSSDLGNLSVSGFYYFLAFVKSFTGIDSYTITRYGGPVITGIVCVITYLIVKRLEGLSAGLLASFFLSLNSFFITRFSMTLRENFSYIFLLSALLFLVIERDKQKSEKVSGFYYILSIGLIISVTLTSHFLTSLIIYSVIFIEIIFFLFKRRRDYAIELILAVVFSFITAGPYIKLIIVSFNWIMINQVQLNKIYIIYFLLILSLVVIIFYYKRLMKLDILMKHSKTLLFIFIVIILLGAFNSIIFPKTFSVLGTYNPPIKGEYFAYSTLCLAVLGFISAFWTSISITMISFSFIIILIMNLPNFDIAFPLFRLIIYISWFLSFLAVKGLKSIYDITNESLKESRIKILFLNKEIVIEKIKTSLIIGSILLLMSPMIISDINASKPTYSYHNQADIDSTLYFKTFLKENDIVIPQYWTWNILRYVGIKVRIDETFYSINDPYNFSQSILSKYPNASRVLVFMIKRWIGNKSYPTPSLDILENYGEKKQFGNIVFYIINLPITVQERELIESPIKVQLPDGPQWVNINITGVDLNQTDFISINIINNFKQKSWFTQLKDIHGNSTEKIRFNLIVGNSTYKIPLMNLKESVDLKNISCIVLCFSWYDQSKIDLTIMKITSLEVK